MAWLGSAAAALSFVETSKPNGLKKEPMSSASYALTGGTSMACRQPWLTLGKRACSSSRLSSVHSSVAPQRSRRYGEGMSWQDVVVVASVEFLAGEAILGEGGQRGGAGGGGGLTVVFEGPVADGCGGHGATGTSTRTTVGERPSSTAQRSGSQERERTRPASAAKASKNAASGSNSRRRHAIRTAGGHRAAPGRRSLANSARARPGGHR